MQVPYNFQQIINNNQYQVINGVKCFSVSMLDENFNYLCKVVNVGSTAPTISYDGQFWFDGTTLKIAQSSSWVDIKVANAVNADKLGGILPGQFLRSDQNTVCSGGITAQQFVSTTTSAPPLVVNSNQLVAGLCADYLDGYHLDSTNAVTGQLVQFDTANVKLKPAPIYYNPTSDSVGIGTTSPSGKLEVYGGYIYSNEAESGAGKLRVGAAWSYPGLYVETANKDLVLGTNSGGIRFMPSGSNCVYITPLGNVGIGTTSPSYKLHVAGNVAVQAGANAFIGTVDNYQLSLRTNNTDRIVIDTSGNVGIGVTPSYKLHVSGNIGIQAGASAFIGTVDNYNLSIRTNNTDRMVVDTNGGVTFYGTASAEPRLIINTVSTTSYALTGLDFIIGGNWIGGLYLDQNSNNIIILQTTGGSRKGVARFLYSTSTAEGQLTMAIPDPVHNTFMSDFPSGWYGGLGTYNITCYGIYYNTLTQRSDANLKTDVQPLVDYLNTDSLDVISCLKPVKYVYIDDPLKVNRFGFIAQDVSEVCPELVTVDTENKASLNYMDLIALLTRGVQELYTMLEKVIQKIGGIS